MKKEAILTKCEGTRYHRVVILNKDKSIVFMAVVSTPLTTEELQQFSTNRIGSTDFSIISSEGTAEDAEKKAGLVDIIGLSSYESCIAKMVLSAKQTELQSEFNRVKEEMGK